METTAVGKVVVAATIENETDRTAVKLGVLRGEQVRRVQVEDAVVDTGATMFSLPARIIRQLGLERVRIRRARTATGIAEFGVYSLVHLVVQGRECILEVSEIPDACPVLIGRLPLKHMDWVVDPIRQRLIGNPDHGGEEMIDMF